MTFWFHDYVKVQRTQSVTHGSLLTWVVISRSGTRACMALVVSTQGATVHFSSPASRLSPLPQPAGQGPGVRVPDVGIDLASMSVRSIGGERGYKWACRLSVSGWFSNHPGSSPSTSSWIYFRPIAQFLSQVFYVLSLDGSSTFCTEVHGGPFKYSAQWFACRKHFIFVGVFILMFASHLKKIL